MKNKVWIGTIALAMCLSMQANDRYFTYSYEPETMPKGAFEFEQWVTLRTGRNRAVGQDNYQRWDVAKNWNMA